ncbi:haloacid dehalogenase type II [Kineococcus gynurae]|uniref:Haloacid dehalogenase type II n=1 Tax=Kineococcus gynurae TaxID=452979 RepID=A0ABV5LWA1_9ACTN
MSSVPPVVVFDVNETLSDLAPLADRFEQVGLPAHAASLWFARVLRDGFALTAVGASATFAELGGHLLRELLLVHDVDASAAGGTVEDAVGTVLDGLARLPLHPDVVEGVRGLRTDGFRLLTLSNGSAAVAEELLTRAGVRAEFEAVLSVEDAGVWKPGRGAYEDALRRVGVPPADAVLVAVHPWDVDGAARAGLRTAWVDRTGGGRSPYPGSFTAPTWRVGDLRDLRQQLGAAR